MHYATDVVGAKCIADLVLELIEFCGYATADVLELKRVFQEMDRDGAGEIDLGGRLPKICLSRMKAPDPLAGDRPGRGAVFARLRDAATLSAVDGVVAELRPLLDAREYTLVFAALGRVRADGRVLPLLDPRTAWSSSSTVAAAEVICCAL